MLKSHLIKMCKIQALKRMVKSMYRNSLNEINMTNKFFTQSAFALTINPCFNFSFVLRYFNFVFK